MKKKKQFKSGINPRQICWFYGTKKVMWHDQWSWKRVRCRKYCFWDTIKERSKLFLYCFESWLISHTSVSRYSICGVEISKFKIFYMRLIDRVAYLVHTECIVAFTNGHQVCIKCFWVKKSHERKWIPYKKKFSWTNHIWNNGKKSKYRPSGIAIIFWVSRVKGPIICSLIILPFTCENQVTVIPEDLYSELL